MTNDSKAVAMRLRISIEPRTLHFRQPAGTSRGVYTEHQTWLLRMTSPELPGREGVGECAPLPDLSCDAMPDYAQRLRAVCDMVELCGMVDLPLLAPYPSMRFGLETAWLSLHRGKTLFDTPFSHRRQGMPINGLVWMGTYEEVAQRLEQKVEAGFRCVKLKIGAIDFDSEMRLIKSLRSRFSPETVELRVDANGAFSPHDAPAKLELLAQQGIHSIEQPIRQRQWAEMARLCASTPLPIALDEELIGVEAKGMREEMLDTIRPQYIVIKPTLHGGMYGAREWVSLARERGIGSWITSALEGSVGLAAVAQLAASIYGSDIAMAQGLGTGALYTDNLPPQTEIIGDEIWMRE